MATQPPDYDTHRHTKPSPKPAWWIPIVVALIVPTLYAVFLGGVLSTRIDANAQDIQDNGRDIADQPRQYVPRSEIDAKLQTIQVQIGSVQASVEAAKEQSERQTAEIIRKLDRLEEPRRTP